MSAQQIDLLTVVFFVTLLLLGVLLIQWQHRRRQAPHFRVRDHLHHMLELELADEMGADDSEKALFQQHQQIGVVQTWLLARRQRLQTVSGVQYKVFWLLLAALVLAIEMVLLWMLPLDTWWGPLLVLCEPPLLLVYAYFWMVGRFQKNFLKQFPEALDLLIRAVRAGVPANLAISASGREFQDPLKSEFVRMGDGLRLGIDLKEVLDDADQRINVPEFSFFAVCLLLQRETGGPLTETLENLAQIIRSRSDLRMKARALTGETRTASKAIAVIPLFIMLLLWFSNPSYVAILFNTTTGLFLLKLSLALIAIGLLVINHMSNLKV